MELSTWTTRRQVDGQTGPVVDFLVLSEFDIAAGSTVRYQYPSEVPGVTPDWLAEQQIPEGIHARESDVSYLFINRNGAVLDNDLHEQGEIDNKRGATDFFLYGINVVRTRKDDTVKRGAVVKSLAVFSRWHFVESFKWVLSKGLDNYFKEPNLETLVTLYKSLNSMDLTGLSLPTTLERQLMQRNVGKVGEMVQVLNEKQQSSKSIDGTTNTTSTSKSPSPRIENRDDSGEVGEDAMMQYCQPSHWMHKVAFDYNNESLDLSIYPHLSPDEVGDINVVRLLRVLKGHTITIFNALLKGSRVMIVGHGHSAKDIAQYVLSAAALIAPSCPGVLRRVYPYVNLSDLSFLEGPHGYLAGALNPMFAQKEEWWDILVDFGTFSTAGQGGPSGKGADDEVAITIKAGADPGRSLGAGVAEETLDTSAHSAGSEDDAASERRMLERSKAQMSGDRAFVAALLAEVEVEKLGEEALRVRFGDLGRACLLQACDDSALLSSRKLSGLGKRSFLVNAHRASDIKAMGGIARGSFRRLWGVGAHWGSAGSDSDTEDDGQEEEEEDDDEEDDGEAIKKVEVRASVATCRHVVRLLSRRLLHEEGLHWGETKALLTGLYDAITTPQDSIHREELTQLMVLLLPAETSGVGADGTDIYACLGVSSHGVQVLASSLYSAAPSVRRVAAQLLDRVRRYKSTTGAFHSLNPMLRYAYWGQKRKDQQALDSEESSFSATTIGSRTAEPRQPAVSSRDASFF